jgi:hypothetical protein
LELNGINDSAKRLLTEGIVKYAQGFYLIMRKKGIKNYKEDISKIMDYFYNMDSKYYGELERQPEDMKELIEFLDNFKI